MKTDPILVVEASDDKPNESDGHVGCDSGAPHAATNIEKNTKLAIVNVVNEWVKIMT